jgi:hypothetical protein
MGWITAPPSIEPRCRHWISRCRRNQVIFRRNESAIPGVRQDMEHQANAKPTAAILSSTANLERLSSDSYSTANLSAPWAGEIEHTTESGAELIRGGNGIHEKYFVAPSRFAV